MKRINQELLKLVADNLSVIYSATDYQMSSSTAAKLARGVLVKIGYGDSTTIVTRKLKDGSSHSFVKVGESVIDITIDHQPYSANEAEYPAADELRGRGRAASKKEEADAGTAPLTVATLIQALLMAPKAPTSRHRDDEQVFAIKMIDVRKRLRSVGVAVNNSTLEEFTKEHMSELKVATSDKNVKVLYLHTGVDLGTWMNERRTVSDLIDGLFKKYVKSSQATG